MVRGIMDSDHGQAFPEHQSHKMLLLKKDAWSKKFENASQDITFLELLKVRLAY